MGTTLSGEQLPGCRALEREQAGQLCRWQPQHSDIQSIPGLFRLCLGPPQLGENVCSQLGLQAPDRVGLGSDRCDLTDGVALENDQSGSRVMGVLRQRGAIGPIGWRPLSA